MSDLQFWLFLAVAIPILLLPAGIAAWKGRNLWPVIALSLVFWPGALGLALRTRGGDGADRYCRACPRHRADDAVAHHAPRWSAAPYRMICLPADADDAGGPGITEPRSRSRMKPATASDCSGIERRSMCGSCASACVVARTLA
ncbi:hypothetical protein ACFZ8E_15425 [Methylobacterium sp. HMF5984]|uniref:hypothetical protein n=1 Tax=Methylobacterium sp. HMF5984 TaxID=3367370 RepID=UPI003853615F